MSEQLTKPFIITLTFVGISALLIAMTSEVTSFNYNPEYDETLEGWETVGGFTINWWENENATTEGYDIDPGDTEVNDLSGSLISTEAWFNVNYDHEADYNPYSPPYGSGTNIRMFIIRDSPSYTPGSTNLWEMATDFFVLSKETQDWPFPNVRYAIIPFDVIYEDAVDNNTAYTQVMLGQLANVTVFLNSTINLQEAMDANNNYTVRLGTPFGAELGSASMWTALGQILTLRLPGCHPVLNVMIAIPLWAGIGFMAVAIISRFIPFIGGG